MSDLPNDLVPLPTTPYDVRPSSLPLDIEECRTAIWLSRGNITIAAQRLKVSPSRLRAFVKNSPRLTEETKEAQEQLVDRAEDIVFEALNDSEDPGRRDQMARFVLQSIGKTRGYSQSGVGGNVVLPKGNMKITWEDGTSFSVSNDDGKTIDVTAKPV